MNNVIEQTKKLHAAENYEVVKVGYDWCFGIPTKKGWKGQVLTYHTKKAATEFAARFRDNIEGS